jgi:hypothetical protein
MTSQPLAPSRLEWARELSFSTATPAPRAMTFLGEINVTGGGASLWLIQA